MAVGKDDLVTPSFARDVLQGLKGEMFTLSRGIQFLQGPVTCHRVSSSVQLSQVKYLFHLGCGVSDLMCQPLL